MIDPLLLVVFVGGVVVGLAVSVYARLVVRAAWTRPPKELDAVADALVLSHESMPTSGEWKRHQVYARLIKRYPDVPRYQLGLAIEQAVDRRRAR
jgi:hypothetical protein